MEQFIKIIGYCIAVSGIIVTISYPTMMIATGKIQSKKDIVELTRTVFAIILVISIFTFFWFYFLQNN